MAIKRVFLNNYYQGLIAKPVLSLPKIIAKFALMRKPLYSLPATK